jgi:putative transposase
MIAFIDDSREAFRVEPISKLLPIASSTYRAHALSPCDPSRLSTRSRCDATFCEKIRRVFEENFSVYGARKVSRQLLREGEGVARCTVERLMRRMGLQGVVRGKPVKTIVSDKIAQCPRDKVNRQFHAPRPNAPWFGGLLLCCDLARFCLCRFRHRRIRTADRRLARLALGASRLCARCARTSVT